MGSIWEILNLPTCGLLCQWCLRHLDSSRAPEELLAAHRLKKTSHQSAGAFASHRLLDRHHLQNHQVHAFDQEKGAGVLEGALLNSALQQQRERERSLIWDLLHNIKTLTCHFYWIFLSSTWKSRKKTTRTSAHTWLAENVARREWRSERSSTWSTHVRYRAPYCVAHAQNLAYNNTQPSFLGIVICCNNSLIYITINCSCLWSLKLIIIIIIIREPWHETIRSQNPIEMTLHLYY